MLKFEDKFEVGDSVMAYDFRPMPDRSDLYVTGVIVRIEDNTNRQGYKSFVVLCAYDSSAGINRIDQEVFIPMEISMCEFDKRITAM